MIPQQESVSPVVLTRDEAQLVTGMVTPPTPVSNTRYMPVRSLINSGDTEDTEACLPSAN